jgi:hypothetical protein
MAFKPRKRHLSRGECELQIIPGVTPVTAKHGDLCQQLQPKPGAKRRAARHAWRFCHAASHSGVAAPIRMIAGG